MNAKDLIEALSNANGVSGFESAVVKAARPFVGEGVDMTVDLMHNAYLTPKAADTGEGPIVLLDGHLDELGLYVQAITAGGQLRVIAAGSWDLKNLLAQKMRLITDDGQVLKGVVASKPPHFMREGEANKPPVIEDVLVDIGCSSRQEAEALGVRLGMPLVPDVAFEALPKQGVLMGKAFDNRMGCALVVDTVNHAVAEGYTNVRGALSTQEEIGGRGAEVVGNVMAPIADVAIVFEGSPADDTFTSADEAQGVIGKGVQVRHIDRTMVSHPEFTALAIRIAKAEGIPYQEAVRRGGGTNGAIYHTKGKGIPTVVLGVPVRYVHAHYGIAKYEDYEAAKALALAIVRHLKAEGLSGLQII